MHKGRGSVPWLNLVSKNDLDLPGVLSAGTEEGSQDAVDGEGELRAKRADVVH